MEFPRPPVPPSVSLPRVSRAAQFPRRSLERKVTPEDCDTTILFRDSADIRSPRRRFRGGLASLSPSLARSLCGNSAGLRCGGACVGGVWLAFEKPFRGVTLPRACQSHRCVQTRAPFPRCRSLAADWSMPRKVPATVFLWINKPIRLLFLRHRATSRCDFEGRDGASPDGEGDKEIAIPTRPDAHISTRCSRRR